MRGELRDRAITGASVRGAAPQVVAVGEATGQHHTRDAARQPGVRVPHADGSRAYRLERKRSVTVVVRPGKGHHRDRRTIAHERSSALPPSSISKLSISGFASRSAHIRSTCARASNASSVCNSRSTSLPTLRCCKRESELLERGAHGLALRVEDAALRPDQDRRLHAIAAGPARYSSNAIPVRSSNAST